MRRSMMRWLHFSLFIGCTVVLFGMGSVGCIPAFRGLEPVTKAELKPEITPQNAAEVLFHKEFRKVRYGQVGQWGMTTFRRVYKRIRYNSRRGFKYSTIQLKSGKVTALEVRTTCPDGRTAQFDLNDVENNTRASNSFYVWRWAKKSQTFTAPGVGVGCVTDFFWEQDIPSGVRGLSFSIQRELPIQKAELTLEYAEGPRFRASLASMKALWMTLGSKRAISVRTKGSVVTGEVAGVKKKPIIRYKHDKGARRLQLWLRKIPAAKRGMRRIARSAMLPPSYMQRPRLSLQMVGISGVQSVNMLTSWKDIDTSYTAGRSWYWDTRTSKQRFYQMDEDWKLKELHRVASAATKSVTGRDAKVRALYNHLRLRMTRVQVSSSAFSPNKLFLLYQLKRATQYEINMMLVVMLRHLKIRAYPALYTHKNFMYQNLAPSKPFRSVLVYIAPKKEGPWLGFSAERQLAKKFLSEKGSKYQGGRKVKVGYVVDASERYLPFAGVQSKFVDTWGFIVDGAGGRMFQAKSQRINQIKRSWNIQAKADGTLVGTLKTASWGSFAVRQRSAFAKMSSTLAAFQRIAWPQGSLCLTEANVKLTQRPELDAVTLKEPFVVSHSFKMQHCLSHAKTGFIYRMWPMKDTSLRSMGGTRRQSIYLGPSATRELSASIAFPAGYTVVGSNVQLRKSEQGLTGAVRILKKGNVLRYSATLKHSKRILPASTFGQLRSVFGLFRALNRPQMIRKAR